MNIPTKIIYTEPRYYDEISEYWIEAKYYCFAHAARQVIIMGRNTIKPILVDEDDTKTCEDCGWGYIN